VYRELHQTNSEFLLKPKLKPHQEPDLSHTKEFKLLKHLLHQTLS